MIVMKGAFAIMFIETEFMTLFIRDPAGYTGSGKLGWGIIMLAVHNKQHTMN